MSARKLRQSWWVDLRFQGRRIRMKSPINTRSGAIDYEASLRRNLALGQPIDHSSATRLKFKVFAEQWFTTYVLTSNKPSEQRTKRSILNNHLLPFFGDLFLSEIASSHIDRFKAHQMNKGIVAKTLNNQLAILKRCLNTAVEWELILKSPQIKPLKAMLPDVQPLTDGERKSLIQAWGDPMWKAMVFLGLHTGMRLGELCGIRWEDIDLEHRRLTVRRNIVRGVEGTPKSHKIRHIPLTEEVCFMLYQRSKPLGLVFSREDGRPVSDRMAANALRRLCKTAGIKNIGWHKLRHTFASLLVMRGVPLIVVQQLLGHSSITMTQRYAHLAPSNLQDAIKLLNGDFGQPVGNALEILPDERTLSLES